MYVYQADTWCDSCGAMIAEGLRNDGVADSGDSDGYPQGPYPEEETDSPNHCASEENCLEAINLGDWGLAPDAELYGAETRKIGAITNDGLTDAGEAYLREMLEPDEIHYTRGIGSGATHVRTFTPYQEALHALWKEVHGV